MDGEKGDGVRGRVRHRRLLLAQGLQLYVFVVVAAEREQLVVRAGLGDRAVFDEVSRESKASQHPARGWGARMEAAYMQFAFWIVERRCAMAIVVRPFAA